MTAGCERVRELAAELALGVADGEERGEALDHVGRCAECRRYVDELAATADEIVLLAPVAEPPLGFEARALERIESAEGRRRKPRRLPGWRIAVAAVASAAAAAVAVWFALGSDRETADRYRETLAVADGAYFAAAPLETPAGDRVGTVFGYQGEPSWCVVVVEPGGGGTLLAGGYDVELVTEGGRSIDWAALELGSDAGSVGRAIPVDYHELSEVRLLGDDGEVAAARFGRR